MYGKVAGEQKLVKPQDQSQVHRIDSQVPSKESERSIL
jgi:hypothetical protein